MTKEQIEKAAESLLEMIEDAVQDMAIADTMIADGENEDEWMERCCENGAKVLKALKRML